MEIITTVRSRKKLSIDRFMYTVKSENIVFLLVCYVSVFIITVLLCLLLLCRLYTTRPKRPTSKYTRPKRLGQNIVGQTVPNLNIRRAKYPTFITDSAPTPDNYGLSQ